MPPKHWFECKQNTVRIVPRDNGGYDWYEADKDLWDKQYFRHTHWLSQAEFEEIARVLVLTEVKE